jgi:hypothetical protein
MFDYFRFYAASVNTYLLLYFFVFLTATHRNNEILSTSSNGLTMNGPPPLTTLSSNYRSATFRPDPSHDVFSRYLPQHQAIITTQDNWKISLSNETTSQILAIQQNNIIGKYIFDFIDPTYRHILLDKILNSRDQQHASNSILIISGDIVSFSFHKKVQFILKLYIYIYRFLL